MKLQSGRAGMPKSCTSLHDRSREGLRALPKGSLGRALLALSHYQTRNIGVGMIATMAWFKVARATATSGSIVSLSISPCARTK